MFEILGAAHGYLSHQVLGLRTLLLGRHSHQTPVVISLFGSSKE